MNNFGKNKSPLQLPPPPPPRRESGGDGGEFQEVVETEDTYEAPPCVIKVNKFIPSQKQEEEDIYSDRCSLRGSPVSQYHVPAKVPAKLSLSLNTATYETGRGSHIGHGKQSSEFQRPGRRLPLPPTDRRLSLPISALYLPTERLLKPTPEKEDDLYLRPIADQDGAQDDVYLTSEPVNQVPVLKKAATSLTLVPGPQLMPRAPKLPKPKPAILGEKHISDAPLDSKCTRPPVIAPENVSSAEDPTVMNKIWYGGHCTRNMAESALLRNKKDGSYMVRQSSGQDCNQPYTLVVLYKGHIYNIPIRYVQSRRLYTLGKEGKAREELFDSVSSIVLHYQDHPLVLIDSQNTSKEQTCLRCPVQP
ncbi:SH2 domain-containing protein 6 [Rhinatrema bivittatum]|uniref:SH2 domain-containing protein 6 n=1 Tax=Rhinatrema bivittatum TaxID=194408 RepID=UPI001127E45A|nr:SH2 domain-containing protein 6 [Rhinatrema bivittatum]